MVQARGRELVRTALWALLLAAATAALIAGGPALDDVARGASDPATWARVRGVDGALLDVLALATWAGLVWLLLGATISVVAHAPGALGRAADRLADALAPALARRLVEALLGATALTGVAGAGTASAVTPPPPPHSVSTTATATVGATAPSTALLGLDWPVAPSAPGTVADVDWPAAPPPSAPSPTTPTTPTTHTTPSAATGPDLAEVVVVRGDTLWRIAARHLGPGAGVDEIARAWPRWHEANRDVIGPDPDRLLPGQRLLPPA